MNDKQASPQIINLFEALKDTLHTASRHMPSERSVGDVPAPKLEDCWCGARNGSPCICKRCDECGNLLGHTRSCTAESTVSYSLPGTRTDAELVEKLATSIERTQVCTYLLDQAAASSNGLMRLALIAAAADIGNGKHEKP